MNNKNLVILTCRNRFFGQTRKPWSSLNVGKMVELLEADGFKVEIHDFHEVLENEILIRNKIIFYAFSQIENNRDYINDIVFNLGRHNNLIPSYDLLKCHENKGYQEIFKKEIGLSSLPAAYYSSYKEVNSDTIQFPVVVKTTQGTNGQGVFLVKNKDNFNAVMRRLRKNFSLATKIDLIRRKYFRKKTFKDYPEYSDRTDYYEYKEYLRVEKNFIIQQYVPNLDFDYRVLVAGNRYYVMKRSVKKGDFRASGSKLFGFSTVPENELLNFAKFVYEKFQSPFMSLDIMFDGTNYFLGEFQALHFGTSAITKSEGYFKLVNEGNWGFIREKPALEYVFALTLGAYLENLKVN